MTRLMVLGAMLTALSGWHMPVMAEAKASQERPPIRLPSGAKEWLPEIQERRAVLPASDRLTAWEIDFEGRTASQCEIGSEVLYYRIRDNRKYDGDKALKAASAWSGWRNVLICVGLDDGKTRWTRSLNGLPYLTIDPKTDNLYIWHESLVELEAESGKVVSEQNIPDHRKVKGLCLGGHIEIPLRHSSRRMSPDAKVTVYDPSRKENRTVSLGDYWLLTGDEKCRLTPDRDGWKGVQPVSGKELWSWRSPDITGFPPLWVDGTPIFITDGFAKHGRVVALDPTSGNPFWSWTLRGPSKRSAGQQLGDGSYADCWRPLRKVGKHVLALDDYGRLVFLTPREGNVLPSITRRSRLCKDYLQMPKAFRDQLIVAGFKGIRSYSLPALLNPGECPEGKLFDQEIRCLLALDRLKEALVLADYWTERAPDWRHAWKLRACICEKLGDHEKECYSRCRALRSTMTNSDPVLREKWGLLRVHDLRGEPLWNLAATDQGVFAGTKSGHLWKIDRASLDICGLDERDEAVGSLKTAHQLFVNGEPFNVPVSHVEPPSEWHDEGGEARLGPSVPYANRLFRTRRDGIRKLVPVAGGYGVKDLKSPLAGFDEPWTIHFSPPNAPIGYGQGVFALDDNLCPVKWLIQPTHHDDNGKENFSTVEFLQSKRNTIGLVTCTDHGTVLQACSRNGKLLNEAVLGRFASSWARNQQLLPMEQGYLFSDRQLVWVNADGETPKEWRFGPPCDRTATDKWGDRWRYFGVPLLIDDLLYVNDLEGKLYVFDAARIRELATKPTRANSAQAEVAHWKR